MVGKQKHSLCRICRFEGNLRSILPWLTRMKWSNSFTSCCLTSVIEFYTYIYMYPFTQNSLNFRDARGSPCLHLVNETVAKISDKSSILYTFKPTVCSIFIQITIFSKNRNTYLPLSYQIRALYVNKHWKKRKSI